MYYINEISELRKDFYKFYDEGRFTEAINNGDKILALYKDNNDTDNIDYARDIYNQGVIYEELLIYDKALRYYQNADKIYKKHNNTESEEYANLKNNLSVCLGELRRYDEAVNTHILVLSLRERLLGRNHSDCIESLINIGNTYADMRKSDKALDYLTKALSRADRNGSFPPMDYSDILCSLARVNAERGNYLKAIANYSKAINIIEKEMPKGSPYFVKILNAAGRACTYAEKYDMAVIYYTKSLELRKNLDETDNVDYIMSLNNLALAYARGKNMEKAEEVFDHALKEITTIMSKNHSFYGDVLINKSFAHSLNGETDKAIHLLELAYSLKERALGKENTGLSTVLSRLARENAKAGEFKKAEEYCNKQLDIAKAGQRIQNIVSAHKDFAHIYIAERNYQAAEEHLISALNLYEGDKSQRKGEAYFSVLTMLSELSALKGNADAAEKYAGRVLAFREISLGNRHPKYAYALYRLAEKQLMNGKFDIAIPNIEKAMDICADTLGKENSRYAEAVNTLKNGYGAAAQYYLRQDCRERALESYKKMLALGGELTPESDIDFAGLYVLKDDFDTAEKIISRYKEAYPEGEKSLPYESWIRLKNGEDSAAEYLYSAPDGIFTRQMDFDLAEYFYRNGDSEKALELYRKALTALKDEKYLRAAFVIASETKKADPDEAKDILKKAFSYAERQKITKSAECADVIMALGNIYYAEKDYADACDCYEKIIVSDCKKYITEALSRMGKGCAKLGKYDDAVEFLSDAALKVKENGGETAEFASLLAKAGTVYMLMGDLKKAAGVFEKAADVFEKTSGEGSDRHIAALLKTAECIYKGGDTKNSMKYYEKAYNLCVDKEKLYLIDKDSIAAIKGYYMASGKLDKVIRIKMGKALQ